MAKREQASVLLDKAEAVRANKKIPPNQRAYEYCALMASWASAMIREDPDRAVSFSREAAEWAKREQVALKAVAQDEYQAILRAVESRREDGEALARLG